ncbi:Vinorine synthase [Acorus calamus]|uniref:Vinorine synthase n=1 Tax=Acorus calamus TaxID=4465 RepID=A0AAV9CM18_ACOCL|nr:Vinorine synthase [Acorus calamus]KAK1290054.1 Vinorine synthase [Acorus calamus]
MEIEILSRETIRPTTPTPPHLRWHRLCALDQLAPQMTVHLVLFYPINGGDKSPPANREAVLKTSLSRLLTSFYPLAGRLRREGPPPNGTASVECTDEGVPFTVARADIELESVLQDDERYIKHYDHLVPRDRSQTDFGDPLLHLQLTHFSCASSSLGICLSHQVADGSSWALLLKAWSASARFGTISPQLTPRFTAASIFPPVNPPPPVIVLPSHRKLHPRRFLIGARALERLRSERTVRGARRPTRFEAAAGAVWRSARRAREGLTNLCLIVGLRPRLTPPVRPDVVGNMWVTTATTTEEGIGEAVSGIDREYARRVIAGEVRVEGHEEGGSSLVFSGVAGYGFYEADFGWGRPRRLGFANHDAGELAMFVGTASGEGVEVWVWLEEEVMVRFEKDPEIIGLVSLVGNSSCM